MTWSTPSSLVQHRSRIRGPTSPWISSRYARWTGETVQVLSHPGGVYHLGDQFPCQHHHVRLWLQLELQHLPVASDRSFQAHIPATLKNNASEQSQTRHRQSSKKAAGSSGDFSSHPGMRIMTKDGRDVTNSASRGSKTKEQRDHALDADHEGMRQLQAKDEVRPVSQEAIRNTSAVISE